MNKIELKVAAVGFIISMMCAGVPAYAENEENRVSYSPEDWPTRWSSAIHQQKTAKFPTRTNTQAPLTELPEAVSDADLFHSPQQGRGMGQAPRPYNYYQPYTNQHFARKGNQTGRDSAHAYQPNVRNTQGYYGNTQYGYQNASSLTVMDPILGHPSLAVPMAPRFPMNMWPFGFMSFGGFPYAANPYGGFPYGGYGVLPYGYPMNNIILRPQTVPW